VIKFRMPAFQLTELLEQGIVLAIRDFRIFVKVIELIVTRISSRNALMDFSSSFLFRQDLRSQPRSALDL
jgi:hypothetical protein